MLETNLASRKAVDAKWRPTTDPPLRNVTLQRTIEVFEEDSASFVNTEQQRKRVYQADSQATRCSTTNAAMTNRRGSTRAF